MNDGITGTFGFSVLGQGPITDLSYIMMIHHYSPQHHGSDPLRLMLTEPYVMMTPTLECLT